MEHKLKLKNRERIEACLAISDFLLNLMKSNLSKRDFEKKIRRLREEHLKGDNLLLLRLSEVSE